jgi:hypothetical protein
MTPRVWRLPDRTRLTPALHAVEAAHPTHRRVPSCDARKPHVDVGLLQFGKDHWDNGAPLSNMNEAALASLDYRGHEIGRRGS